MKLLGVVLICFLTGCSTLDHLTGVGSPGDGVVGEASSVLSSFGGWGTVAGGILGLLGSTYGAYRAKRYGAIATSLVKGVQRIRSMRNGSGKINLSEETLCDILASIQTTDNTKKQVEKIIKRVEEEELTR